MSEGVASLRPGWRMVRFDEIFHRVERKVLVDDSTEYSTVGVRWYGNGAFVRDRLLGADIARKQQWVIKSGDVVYNKLFAWKGAFAIAEDSVDGQLVSDKFPTYSLDESLVHPEFVAYYFRTSSVATQAERMSKGAAAISKLTLNPPQFWDLTMPVPDREEQRRIVEILRDCEQRISEAQQLRRESTAESEALMASMIGDTLAALPITGRLHQVLSGKPRNGWSAPCDNIEGGTPVLSLGAVTGFTYRPTECKLTSAPTASGAHYWLSAGDLLVTRSNTEKLVGHAAIYSGEPSPCIYPDLMMRVPVDPAKADTRFVYYWLRTPAVREILERAGSGTSSTMKKITQGDLMELPFPTSVTVSDQRAVTQRLDEVVARIEAVRKHQEATRAELDALFPSVLDRAMHGESNGSSPTEKG